MSRAAQLVRQTSELGEWETVTLPVAAALAPYVEHITGWWERTAFTRRREVPTPIAVLIINIGNRLNVNERGAGSPFDSFHAFFAGLHSSHVVTESTGGIGGGIQVDFTPLGAYLFTGIPAHELANRVLHAEDVLGEDGRLLVDRLECTPSWEDRFELVEQLVLARMARAPRASEGVAWAWSRLARAQGLLPIAALRAELGWTPRQLIDGFRRELGLPPKQMARILRFHHAIDLLAPESA
jgi:AraC-like DNA-binding protein